MTAAWTRLVRIQSGEIEPHSINDETPRYLAISHTWADSLFPAGVPFLKTLGSSAVHSLSHTEFQDVAYCWVDTLCIDQTDEEDKQRQIPLMGLIYGNAQVVAIVTEYPLGLSQERIDSVTASVQGAIDMSMNSSWTEDGKRWSVNEKNRLRLKRAMECLEVFTRPAWGSRVWTLQEFILAKRTIWIGGDLQPLRIDEKLFLAIPDVCDYLSIEECLIPKFEKLYCQFQGMASAHLRLIDPTRVMELLGNRQATVPEDEVYGLMAASGVILQQTSVKGKEKAWALWWEEAIQNGHTRWALLPPAMTPAAVDAPAVPRNCIMPGFSVRHLASTNSNLDSVQSYGPVKVDNGTVSMFGRLAGRCEITRKLGQVHLDPDGAVVRDVTLVLFASNRWDLALSIASAFGAGRYRFKQRAIIAQVLFFNYYRARLAVLEQRTKRFRPRFRNQLQASIWADFMLLQSSQARVMNDTVAFLAKISNDQKSTDVIIVTDGVRPSGNLWAVDFGAINTSGRTMFTIVKAAPETDAAGVSTSCQSPTPPSLHREGVSMYMQVADDITKSSRYASHILEQPEIFHSFDIGGTRCPVCPGLSSKTEVAADESTSEKCGSARLGNGSNLKLHTRLEMRKQNRALKIRWKKRRLRQKAAR